MGELVLIRHGETEWSRELRHTSYTDLPLTPHGEEQARAVGKALDRASFGVVLTSPMSRARRTAELAGLEPTAIDPNLMEWDYGGYEGLTTAQIRETRPGWDLWTQGVVPGPDGHPGETPEQIGARADRLLDRLRPILADPAAPDALLIAHAHVLRVLTARRIGLPPAAGALFRLGTATVSRLGTEHGRPVISNWNNPAGG
jgi:probable phosphoglycerate mutase